MGNRRRGISDISDQISGPKREATVSGKKRNRIGGV